MMLDSEDRHTSPGRTQEPISSASERHSAREPEEQVALLATGGDEANNVPLERLVQKAAEIAGFDAGDDANEETVRLPEDVLLTAKSDGTVRYCRKCQAVKPDRAHHCSICGQCVLLMDHHCPWISTCVGHRNRKAFVLFLTYATAFSFYSGLAAGLALLHYTDVHRFDRFDYAPLSWAFLLLLGGIFGLVLTGFSGYHWWLVAHNRTTLENMESSNRVRFSGIPTDANERYRSDHALSRKERKILNRAAARLNIFDLGTAENLAQTFGPPRNGTSPFGRMGWMLPSGPVRGDGRTWPINDRHRIELERISREVRRVDEGSEASTSVPTSALSNPESV